MSRVGRSGGGRRAWKNRRCSNSEPSSDEALGQAPESLFPAWVQAQQAVLDSIPITPPTTVLAAPGLSAARWHDQRNIDWILLTPSLAAGHRETAFIDLNPAHHIHFSLLWPRARQTEPSLARFIRTCLTTDLPAGWSRLAT